jgi:hypothetical protein
MPVIARNGQWAQEILVESLRDSAFAAQAPEGHEGTIDR